MMIVAWLFGPLFNLARMIPTTQITEDGFCIFNLIWPSRFWFGFASVIVCGLYFFIPFIFILILYLSIFIQLRKRASEGPLGEGNKKQTNVMDKAKDNVFKTILFLSTCSFLCHVWNSSFFLLFSFGVPLSTTTLFYNFSVFMVNINCCVNPFCYAVQYREFQQQVKTLFCGTKTQMKKEMSSVDTRGTSCHTSTVNSKTL